ncbi:MAG: Ig-like domain-containing protein, partial [Gammaproteobacteria bacterium]
MTKRYLSLFTLALAVLISGCGVSSDESVPPSASPTAGFKVRYAPLGGIVPFPNDLFLNGSTDGTLNIPVADPTDYSNPLVAINALDGYSTTAAIEATFTDAIDAATLAGNQTVFVFKLTATGATPLMEGTDYNLGLSPAADSAGTVLQITPLKPLDPDTSYAVFLTTDIKSSTGANVTADTAFQQIKDAIASGQTLSNATLEQIREQAIEPLIGLATQAGLSSDKIAVAFSFTTQSIGDVLSEIEANVTPQFSQLQDTGLTTQQVLGSASPGIAEIYSGVIQVPYYLSKNSPLSGFWQGAGGSFLTRNNTTPVATETLTIPVLVTVPNAGSGHTKPATGWPTVLFQHG